MSSLSSFSHRLRPAHSLQLLGAHGILLAYTALALFPIVLVLMNSFKTRRAIFKTPYALPNSETWSTIGYETVFKRANFPDYFLNSLIVTVSALILILIAGTMAAWALAEYRFPGNNIMGLYLALGIMIPIRLGTVSILRLVVNIGLIDTLWALILVYTASGLPLAIFVLTNFMRQVPRDLKDAARVDGASEFGTLVRILLPLMKPALAVVALFQFMGTWADYLGPLIYINSPQKMPLSYALYLFQGAHGGEQGMLMAASTLVMLPVLLVFFFTQRYFIQGITLTGLKG